MTHSFVMNPLKIVKAGTAALFLLLAAAVVPPVACGLGSSPSYAAEVVSADAGPVDSTPGVVDVTENPGQAVENAYAAVKDAAWHVLGILVLISGVAALRTWGPASMRSGWKAIVVTVSLGALSAAAGAALETTSVIVILKATGAGLLQGLEAAGLVRGFQKYQDAHAEKRSDA